MTVDIDDTALDDPVSLADRDPAGMLRAVATSASQVRRAATAAREAGLERLDPLGRPRAVVIAGMGGSGIAGDVLSALAAPISPVPVTVHRGPSLPAWVGAADVVVAVSCSGATAETLSSVDEAARRGAALVGVGAAGSPLAERCTRARAPFVAVTKELTPRSSLWALAAPVVAVGARLGLVDLGPDDETLEQTAARLETVAEVCRPDRESFVNPGKQLALDLAGTIPLVWGAGPMGAVASYRCGCQLAENAKYPAVVGALPEAHHNQVVTFDGTLAGGADDDDLFRDRVDDEAPLRIRLVLLHDDDGDDAVRGRVRVSEEVAARRGVPVSLLTSEGASALERLASIVGVVDYATAYLAIATGVDPTPVDPIDELKAQLS